MSSKSVDPGESAASGIRWMPPRSIAARLTVLFVISTATLLALTAGAHYLTLKGSLDARDHAMVGSKINVLRLLLREEGPGSEILVHEVEHEAATDQPMRYFLRVLDAASRITVETSGMQALLPPLVFPPAGAEGIRHAVRDGNVNRVFLLRTAPAALPDATYLLHVALEVTSDEELLAFHRRRMLAVLAVGVLLAAALGLFVAHDALRPLQAIARALRRITATRLDERLAATRWPHELSDLAQSCDEMLDRLRESFDRLSQFSADLAHELRTPIGNLRGETEVALSRTRSAGEYQQVLASSLEEYERLSRMIAGLLFLARAENVETAITRVPVNVRQEIEAVRDFFEALAADRTVRVACEGTGSILGDPLLLRRALSNLLSNALQHTSPGGQVTMSVRAADTAETEILIRDTGHGIAAEHLPRIFDRFYRVDQARSYSTKGAGLGLAIVHSIMRLHGGTATIHSTVGEGTIVALRFPAVIPPQAPAQVGEL